MSSEKIKQWFRETLLPSFDRFEPDKCGRARVLFESVIPGPTATLYMDPPDGPQVSWPRLPGQTGAESLCSCLEPALLEHASFRFFVIQVEGEAYGLHHVIAFERKMWTIELFRLFDDIDAKGGEERHLCFVLGDCRGLLVFRLGHNAFEITFYGDDDLWTGFAAALQNQSASNGADSHP